MRKFVIKFFAGTAMIFLSACQAPNIGAITSEAKNIFSDLGAKEDQQAVQKKAEIKSVSNLALNQIIKTAPASNNSGGSFLEIVRFSAESNPEVLSAKANYTARLASIDLAKTSTEFKLSGTLIGGVEDVTDETAGVAALINGKKVIYDGGKIDSQISKEEFLASAALADYKIIQNKTLAEALSAWVNLKRYATLNEMIQSRLDVLAPLITQLEQVAKAGVGDASQVAAAERTVNMIRATEREIITQLAQASVSFENIFGISEPGVPFLGGMISSSSIPSSGIENLVSASPAVKLHYARYGAAVANLNSVIAKDSFDVGLEAKVQRPFGGSGYDSDESIGFVVRKIFRDGGSLDAERRVSVARVDAEIDMLRSAFRSTNKTIEESQEIISAIRKALQLASANAKNAKEEINYLRQQLVIGQSTLDNVLSAEARLYEAEAKSINFASDQYLAEITMLAALGILAPIFEVK